MPNLQFSMDHHESIRGNCVHNSQFSYHKIPYKTHAFNVLFEWWTVLFWRGVLSAYFLTESVLQSEKFGKHCYSPRQNLSLTSPKIDINLNTADLRRNFSCNYTCYSSELTHLILYLFVFQTLLR